MNLRSDHGLLRRARTTAWLVCVGCIACVAASARADAEDWAALEPFYNQVTRETVEGFPAVVLFERAKIRFQNFSVARNSQMDVEVRVKVLNDQGVQSYGSLAIEHSRQVRLSDIEGRTIRPDGSVVPLDSSQVFRERRSRSAKEWVTKVAFPAVETGSIIDYRYRIYWSDLLYLEPWTFQRRVPVLHSQVQYVIPSDLVMRFWGVETTGQEMQKDLAQDPARKVLTVWMENVPALPVEPMSPADSVLSSRVMLIPELVKTPSGPYELMKSWVSVGDLFDDVYARITNKDRASKQKARELVASAGDEKGRAEAIYRFVRKEIDHDGSGDVWPTIEAVDDVLESAKGSPLEIALLLQTMLAAIDIDADLVWMANSNRVFVDPSVPNPTWYEGAAVRVEVGGETYFLDASDPGLGFGRLSPGFDGSVGVVMKRKEVEWVELPRRQDRDSLRHLDLDLQVDAEGRTHGRGELNLRGHWAEAYIDGRDTAARQEGWESWLAERHPDWDVSAVEFTESADDSHVSVSWRMARTEELVLGDEVEILPADLVMTRQHFESSQRVTPILFHYLERTYLDFELTWQEGWELEAFPETTEIESAVGRYFFRCDRDDEARRLSCSRKLQRAKNSYDGDEEYQMLRELYETASRSDARTVSLMLP